MSTLYRAWERTDVDTYVLMVWVLSNVYIHNYDTYVYMGYGCIE